ncbi:Dehydroquinate synthase-like protein [Acaromyces ingoldii]|uniref:Dehydroquinate synthase-like protein n=1 Tax=Acaromyces ingoldii TaxID=215250 RepID=A0A316YMK7_9BASI|nr:Dehydroquinate synthase-like protein [Acaromyces ingoldii]PWN90780.1 Dehydroquinate synthase-like protein [Acaromyces ingoldii]
MRAVDHAVEFLYRPDPSPLLRMAELGALRELFHLLPATKRDPSDINVRQRLQLAAIVSLHPESRKGALGLSHGLGHALGATYAIPHGITSCITLAAAIKTTAQLPSTPAEQLLALSDALDFIPAPYNAAPAPLAAPVSIKSSLTGVALEAELAAARQRGVQVATAVQRLVDDLGLRTTLQSAGVPRKDIDSIASHVTAGKPAIHDAVVQLLETVYDGVNL